ncbi:MAG: hypothetical protein IT318_24690 [Anaerolineales bacterium]|nr:hypothetical protein [Anaerolineales bacterium]
MNATPWLVPFCAGALLTVIVQGLAALAVIVLMARDAPEAALAVIVLMARDAPEAPPSEE